jgi:prepilin-type N-terminal cleavage/methylation domain-containing protein
MMQIQIKPGFSLVEALLAVAIMAIMLTPLFILQATKMQTTVRASRTYDRVTHAYTFLLQQGYKQSNGQGKQEKNVGRPVTTLTFERGNIPKKSVLSRFNDCVIERVLMTWRDGTQQKTDTLVRFVYKPKKGAA